MHRVSTSWGERFMLSSSKPTPTRQGMAFWKEDLRTREEVTKEEEEEEEEEETVKEAGSEQKRVR